MNPLTLAHVGHCTNAEAASTIGVSGLLAVLLFRPWRKVATVSARITRLALPLVLAVAVTATGCGGGKSSSSSTNRPATDARIQIVQPTPNQVTGPDVTLVVNLIGAKVVQPAKGTPRPDEGHIHLYLDGALVSMSYALDKELEVMPGTHQLAAEFVAVDHGPFNPRVRAVVEFRVAA